VIKPHTLWLPLDVVLVLSIVGLWLIARRRQRNRPSAT